MPKGKKLTMRKFREVLRLHFDCGLSLRLIGKSCRLGKSSVSEYIRLFNQSGLSWPLSEDQTDGFLEKHVFNNFPFTTKDREHPDCAYLSKELRKKGVTLALLWEEFRLSHPNGVGYSQFCSSYQRFKSKQSPVMRQAHKAGEKLFVDYAGQTIPIYNSVTGEVRSAQIFVAVLGASNYSYAEATWSQNLGDWISSHVRCFSYLKGVPKVVVMDNLKAGVTRPCRYDPDLNPSYQEMAKYYDCALMPARVRKPKDKAKAEAGVLLVERWILARLRHERFTSLAQLNQKIQELLERLNARPFQKMEGSRKSWYEDLERSVLKPLPCAPYELGLWKKAKVHIDYHIELEGHYYSVPWGLIGKIVETRTTHRVIEIFFDGKRIASHQRSLKKGQHSTLAAHRPKGHNEYLKWNPKRLLSWGNTIGPHCAYVLERVMFQKAYPEQGFRACLGILRLSKSYTEARLEKACQIARTLQCFRYKTIASLLKGNRDLHYLFNDPEPSPSNSMGHSNVRGKTYYHERNNNVDGTNDGKTAFHETQWDGASPQGPVPGQQYG